MRIPQQFKLFNQNWRIRLSYPMEIGDDLGQCRADLKEIVLNPNQTPETLFHTLWHELVHAIEETLLLEMTERQVDLVALGIIDLLRSNSQFPELFDHSESTDYEEDPTGD